MAEEKERIEFAKLPSVDTLPPLIKTSAKALLQRLDAVVGELTTLEEEESVLKQELERLQQESGRAGFRHGPLCFVSQEVAGRKTLDRMLLMENGCTAAIINASFKLGQPSTRCTFKHLEEEPEV